MQKAKQLKCLVFAKGDHVEQAKKAGADYVGADDLLKKSVVDGWILIMQLQLLI